MNAHMEKLNKALKKESYSDACSALRSLENECAHASEVAVTLSLNSHLTDQRR